MTYDDMRKHSLSFISFIALLSCFFDCSAQTEGNFVKTFALGYGDKYLKKIHLRWFVSKSHCLPNEGYTILRKKHGAPMIHQIVGYVQSHQEKNTQFTSEEQKIADTLMSYMNKMSKETISEPLIEWSLQYLQCVSPDIVASALGLQFTDTTVRAGIQYDYRIDIGTTTIATISNISTHTSLQPKVNTFNVEELSYGNRVTWDTDHDSKQGIVRWLLIRKQLNVIDTVAMIPKVLTHSSSKLYEYEDTEVLNEDGNVTYSIIPIDYWNTIGKSYSMTIKSRRKAPRLPTTNFISFQSTKRNILLKWTPAMTYGYRIYRQFGGEKNIVAHQIDRTVTSYIDTIRSPVSYSARYFIACLDSIGREGELSMPIDVPIDDEIPPITPRYVIVQPKQGMFELMWAHSTDQDKAGYEIARSLGKDQNFYVITHTPVKDSIYLDSAVQSLKSGKFIYRVRTVDIFGNTSDWSEGILVSMPDLSVPMAPLMTEIKASDKSIELRWQRVAELDLAGYWVNRTDDTLFTPITLNEELLPRENTQYNDTLIKAGILYFYEVVSVDSSLNISAPSIRLSARSYDKSNPAPPIIDSVYYMEGKVRITWFFEYPPPIPVYVVVERSRDNKRYVQISAPLAETEKAFSDTDIGSAEKYYYRVRALSKEGNYGKPSDQKSIESSVR
jgi:hypothetical protein